MPFGRDMFLPNGIYLCEKLTLPYVRARLWIRQDVYVASTLQLSKSSKDDYT